MIKKSKGGGFEVRSHSGKRLSKPGMTKKEAVKRLRQVEGKARSQGKSRKR